MTQWFRESLMSLVHSITGKSGNLLRINKANLDDSNPIFYGSINISSLVTNF